MAKSRRTGEATDGFVRAVEQALEHFTNAQWLGDASPLAAPYFIGNLLNAQPESDTSQGRGRVLQHVLQQAAQQLTAEQQHFCNISFFQRDPNLNNIGVLQRLGLPETTYYRHRGIIIEALAHGVSQSVLSPARPEVIPKHSMVGRADHLRACLHALNDGHTVAITGSSGTGKTTLGATTAQAWPGSTHWYTIRPGFNDQLMILLFSLGHCLHRLGVGNAWRQIIADKGQIQMAHVLGLLRGDLTELRDQRKIALLLCIDEVDLLNRERHEHAQIIYLLEELRDLLPLLLIGQSLVIDTPHQQTLTGLSLDEVGALIQHKEVSLSPEHLRQLSHVTRNNAALLTIATNMLRAGESAATLLAQLSVAPSLELLLSKLWQRLGETERALLQALSVFRSAIPQDAWSGAQRTLHSIVARDLVVIGARRGIEVLPYVRAFVLRHTPADALSQHHLAAAEILETRGVFTEAAYHYIQGRQPAMATWLWFRHRLAEREHGQVPIAWQIFADVASTDFSNEDDRRAFAMLRAFQAHALGLSEEIEQAVQMATWPIDHPITPYARQWQGKSREMQGRLEQALAYYREGLTSISGLLDARRTILHVLKGDIFLIHERDFVNAKTEALEAQFEAETFRGLVEEDLGNMDLAQRHYHAAGSLLEQLKDNDDARARISSHLGRLHYRLGNGEQSIHYSQLAIKIFRAQGSATRIANEQMTLSMIYISAQRYLEAYTEATDGLNLAQTINVPYLIAGLAANAGEACVYLQRFDDGERYALLSLHTEEAYVRPYALTVIGMIHHGRGQLDASTHVLGLAIESAQEMQDRFAEAPAWRWLGRVHRDQHNVSAAHRAFDKAFSLYQALSMTKECETTLVERSGG